MKLLLDTHVFLWWLRDDDRLSQTAREHIGSRRNECYLSVVTAWEMAVKAQLGRLDVQGDFASFLNENIRCNGFRVLPVSLPHALALHALPLHHRDPFDRMLVAQAMADKLVLVSSDRKIRAYSVDLLW